VRAAAEPGELLKPAGQLHRQADTRQRRQFGVGFNLVFDNNVAGTVNAVGLAVDKPGRATLGLVVMRTTCGLTCSTLTGPLVNVSRSRPAACHC